MSTPSSQCSCSGSAAPSLRHFDDGADRFDRGGTSRLLSGQGDTNRTAVVFTLYASRPLQLLASALPPKAAAAAGVLCERSARTAPPKLVACRWGAPTRPDFGNVRLLV